MQGWRIPQRSIGPAVKAPEGLCPSFGFDFPWCYLYLI